MSEYLMHARTVNNLVKNKFTNTDRVLAEIMQMSSVKKNLAPIEIITVIPARLKLSETNVRKVLSELKTHGVINKDKGTYSINPIYLKK